MKDWVLLLVGLLDNLSCLWSPNGLSGICLLVSLNLDCNLGTLLNLKRGLCASYVLSYPLTRANLLVDTIENVLSCDFQETDTAAPFLLATLSPVTLEGFTTPPT